MTTFFTTLGIVTGALISLGVLLNPLRKKVKRWANWMERFMRDWGGEGGPAFWRQPQGPAGGSGVRGLRQGGSVLPHLRPLPRHIGCDPQVLPM